MTRRSRGVLLAITAVIAVMFGLLTIKEGGSVLFVDGPARAAAGHYVPFVLWFNFIAGFTYLIAGAGLWWRHRWAALLAIAIATATLLVFAAFLLHVRSGGEWEQRTLVAMTLRSVVWLVIAGIGSHRLLRGRPSTASAPASHRNPP